MSSISNLSFYPTSATYESIISWHPPSTPIRPQPQPTPSPTFSSLPPLQSSYYIHTPKYDVNFYPMLFSESPLSNSLLYPQISLPILFFPPIKLLFIAQVSFKSTFHLQSIMMRLKPTSTPIHSAIYLQLRAQYFLLHLKLPQNRDF